MRLFQLSDNVCFETTNQVWCWLSSLSHQRCQSELSKNPEMVANFLKMHFWLYFCTVASEKNFLKSGNFLKTGISVTLFGLWFVCPKHIQKHMTMQWPPVNTNTVMCYKVLIKSVAVMHAAQVYRLSPYIPYHYKCTANVLEFARHLDICLQKDSKIYFLCLFHPKFFLHVFFFQLCHPRRVNSFGWLIRF